MIFIWGGSIGAVASETASHYLPAAARKTAVGTRFARRSPFPEPPQDSRSCQIEACACNSHRELPALYHLAPKLFDGCGPAVWSSAGPRSSFRRASPRTVHAPWVAVHLQLNRRVAGRTIVKDVDGEGYHGHFREHELCRPGPRADPGFLAMHANFRSRVTHPPGICLAGSGFGVGKLRVTGRNACQQLAARRQEAEHGKG